MDTKKTPKRIRYAGATYRLAESEVVKSQPYGPGKFDDTLGEWLYNEALEGKSREELGDVQDFNHYDLLVLDQPVIVEEESGEHWTFLGAILEEDSQGFVHYVTFNTKEEALDKWKEIEEEYEKFAQEQE